jgi:hypothetical protein
MIDLDCLNRAPANPEAMLLSDGLLQFVAVITYLSIIVAILIAPLVHRLYRRRIVRLMRFEQVCPQSAGWWKQGDSGESLSLAHEADASQNSSEAVQFRQWRIDRATIVAWLVFSLGAFPVSHGLQINNDDWSDTGGLAVVAALLALCPALINMRPSIARQAARIGVATCVGLSLIVLLTEDIGNSLTALIGENSRWEGAFSILALGAVNLVMVNRTLRGLVFPISVVATLMLLLTLIPYGLIEKRSGSCMEEFAAKGSGTIGGLPVQLSLIALAGLGMMMSFKALSRLANLISRGWISEVSMISAGGLGSIALVVVITSLPADPDDYSPLLIFKAAPWLLAIVAAYALALGKKAPATPGRSLLILRVFARKNRTHELLDIVQSHWRYVGPVYQIGGPDLATMNVDPYECMMFLSGRLHEIFLPEPESPDQLQVRLNRHADQEGRYSINEVFCFNTAWRVTVEQLMKLSDTIILDVRGFTLQREGASYEIEALARSGLLARTLAIGDRTTDWTHVDSLIANASGNSGELQRLNAISITNPAELFDRLLGVSTARLT